MIYTIRDLKPLLCRLLSSGNRDRAPLPLRPVGNTYVWYLDSLKYPQPLDPSNTFPHSLRKFSEFSSVRMRQYV